MLSKMGGLSMVSGLIHKKRSFCFTLCLAICVLSVFCGCDPRSNQYPFQKAEQWLSHDPQIILSYTQNDDQTWSFHEEVYWNGDIIEIEIAMQSDIFCVYPVDSNHYDDRLFSGTWKYRKDALVLVVEEDFLFNNQYSEIILIPVS